MRTRDSVTRWFRFRAGLWLAMLLPLVSPERLHANVDGIELLCPCRLELRPDTEEASIVFGVRNFRPTGTGPLSVRFNLLASSGGYFERTVAIDPIPAGATLRRFAYPVRGSAAESKWHYLQLDELAGSEEPRVVDRVPLLPRPDDASVGRFVFESPDFLTDSDGDGVADANERIEGTDPASAESVPGGSTLDVLALYNDAYAANFNHAPHTRIHHLMTVANLAYGDSGTNIRLRTVGFANAEVTDPQDKYSLPSQGQIEDLGRLHGSDLNVLFRASPNDDRGGFAFVGGALNRGYMPSFETGLVATIFESAPAYIVAHEIGHLLGLTHSFDQGLANGTFRWSRGHAEPHRDRGTIMSWGGRYFGFSDPAIDCWGIGIDCGVAHGEWDGADAVASLDAVRFQVARYREAEPDSDGDNVVDPADRFPLDAAEWRDSDGDGVGDAADPDDDNDTVPDMDDRFPLDPTEWADIDNDGIGDNADTEATGDGGDALIPDPVLRRLIADTLGLPPDTSLDANDLASLTELRGEQPTGVRSLEGLQHAGNLTRISLRGGSVVDLAPLSGLRELNSLDLAYHNVRDLSPLSGLANLQQLNVEGNRIANVAALADLTNLEWAYLGENYLDDGAVEILGSLTGLQALNLSEQKSEITDITALADLRKLQVLRLGGHERLKDIGVIANFRNLRSLDLDGTAVSDLSPLANLSDLFDLSLSGTPVSDLSPLSGLPALSWLQLAGNSLSDLSVLSGLGPLSWLNLGNNNISDIAPLVEESILADGAVLVLSSNPLSHKAIHLDIPTLRARDVTVHFNMPALVDIPDESLRSALARAIGQAGGVALPEEDLSWLLTLDLSGLGITNLTGLEKARWLRFINLAGNAVEDLAVLFDLPDLQHLTLDDAALGREALRPAIEALREKGVTVGAAASAMDRSRFDECRPGMLLIPGERCTYPGATDAFSVNSRGRGSFLGRLAGIRIWINNETINDRVYDFEASHLGGGEWRVDRVAGGSDAPANGAADSQEPVSNTSPSFADACFPHEIWYWDGEPIPSLTLPAATGGDGPLKYTLEVVSAVSEHWDLDPRPPLIPGLSFDPARRQIAGTPMTNADSNWPYGLKYRVTDADGDTDEFEFEISISGIGFHSHGHAAGNICDQSLTDSFTDSTGRTILFRLHYRKDWDLSEPRGVELYFHGNSTGTELDMLDYHESWRSDPIVPEKGMLRAAVASPYSYPNPDFSPKGLNDGTRSWVPDDARLIHELLQSNFGGTAAIDRNSIVFTGDSQGPCFINYFLQRYAHVYGGGFHSDCGCLHWGDAWPPRSVTPWSPTVLWTLHALSSVSDRFRVFVQATTGDFLYGEGVAMRDFFRDVLGFETRWDLDAPGGHCAGGAMPYSSIFEWLTEPTPVPSVFGAVSGDHDVDGLADAVDPDDDNDGAPDIVDALPLEPREWLDTDADGIGNFEDRDADGDGVLNAVDAFPMNPLEWIDNDEDGIGDNLDTDDDNDGVADEHDDEPLRGARNDQLSFKSFFGLGFLPRNGFHANPKPAQSHIGRPASIVYPDARGNRQSYFFIALGDSADAVFEIMVDTHESDRRCEDVLPTELCRTRHEGGFGDFHEARLHLIYIDGNQNRDLSDDGPPLVMADNGRYRVAPDMGDLGVSVVLRVPYASGERLPYRIALTSIGDRESDQGHRESEFGLGYNVSSFWIGYVTVPGAEPVLAGTFDGNLDGVFNTGTYGFDDVFEVTRLITEDGEPASSTRLVSVANLDDFKDHACVDLNRDDILNDCGQIIAVLEEDAFAPIYPGEPFMLDGRSCRIQIAPTGYRVRIECS